jgi:hypothetical protein
MTSMQEHNPSSFEAAIMRPPLDYPAGHDMARDYTLTNSARGVYNHLATRCTFAQFETVKIWSIEKRLRIHRDTVIIALRLLARQGYIECRPSGKGTVNAYRLVWSRTASNDRSAT